MGALLIGLQGRARAGKDTVAARLVAEHGFVRLAFADELKRMAEEIDPLVYDHDFNQNVPLAFALGVGGWERAKDRTTARAFLQKLGESVRMRNADFWVDVVWSDYAMLTEDRIVITDVRYPNEVAWIRNEQGANVRVVRPGLPEPKNPHISETYDLIHDRTILNDGELDDLDAKVDALVASLEEGLA